MFDFLFPKEWSTLKKLIWLKATVVKAAYSIFTGTIARFLSPSSKPVKSIVCNIEPVQAGSGDPSPDNVRPITGHTGLNVYGTGKNLLPLTLYSGGSYNANVGVTFTFSLSAKQFTDNGSGVFTLDTTASWENYTMLAPIKNTGQRVIFSGNLSAESQLGYTAYVLDKDFAVLSKWNGNSNPFDFGIYFNLSSYPTCAYIALSITNRGTAAETLTLTQPQLEESEGTATDYEPYVGATLPVSWQSEAGTVYAGYCSIDKDGNVTLTGTWAKIAFKPNKISTWMDADASRATLGFYLNAGDFNAEYSAPKANNVIFEEYRKASAYANENAYVSQFVFINGAFNRFEARVPKSELDAFSTYAESQAAVLAYLEDNPIAMCYELASPVTYTLSSVTVPSTVQGENNWWHDANGNITIEAIGSPIPDEADALQALNILLGGAYTPRANFSEPTDEQALNIIMGGSR